MNPRNWFLGLFGLQPRQKSGAHRRRGPATHVIILDGTMSSLSQGNATNAGRTFKLLREVGQRANLTVYYEAGIQWTDWYQTWDVMTGRGMNRQIRRAYGVLASRYRPGDTIILMGYSRGAFAVRSLAGLIGRIGLLKHDEATVSAVRTAYRHYQAGGGSVAASAFRRLLCHDDVQIEAVGVWDTVKALGRRTPLDRADHHGFHDHRLGRHVRYGFHALALDERRNVYRPVMWDTSLDGDAVVEQVWFRGTHGDVGGQVGAYPPARPLANIPLVWMLEKINACGVPLPDGWKDRFPCDSSAPSIGQWHGWAKVFLLRQPRAILFDPSERLHDSIAPVVFDQPDAAYQP
ncbi:DUF2235 domain-containing protein [Loktanella salsilacus]|uniref:DUF2235 domain-containing protein n=1 Tax=Loktanella salsilacus TaxID=195913 RepID=UPI003988F621